MSAVTGGSSRMETCVLFGSNAPHEANSCRRLEHETGRWERARTLAAQARARAEECMSPRPSLDSGTESPEYGGESPMAGRGASAAKPLWSGSGGRWLPWPTHIELWAAILIIGYRGISAIVLNETPSSASSGNGAAATPVPSGPSFPVTLSSAYALQFGQVYLNFSPNNATARARELAAFIPAKCTRAAAPIRLERCRDNAARVRAGNRRGHA
jgi:hypothetical protein